MSIILQIWDNFYVISPQVLNKKKQNTWRVNQDSEPWDIQNRSHTQNIWSTMKRFEKQLTAVVIFEVIIIFAISAFPVHETNIFFLNAGLIFTFLFNVKKYGGRARKVRDREIWYTSSKFYSGITYYFWLSTFSNLRATS